MSYFGLDPTQEQNVMDDALRRGLQTTPDMSPAWYSMSAAPTDGPTNLSDIGPVPVFKKGIASGVSAMASLAYDAVLKPVAKTLVGPIDSQFNYPVANWLDDQSVKNRAVADNLRLDPKTNGVLAQVVHGFGALAPVAAATVATGGLAGLAQLPVAAGAVQGYQGFNQAIHDNLDPGTALGMGAIEGLSAWAGLKIPMHASAYFEPLGKAFGGTEVSQLAVMAGRRYGVSLPTASAPGLTLNVAAGAGASVPLGMTSRGITGDWLNFNGYPDQAKAYQALDKQAIATDLIMGGAFGALAHYGPKWADRYQKWKEGPGKGIQDSDLDAAFAMNNALHIETDLAPGIPATPEAREAHLAALQIALEKLSAGEPVNVGDAVTKETFVENPTAEATRLAGAQAIAGHMGQDWVDGLHDTHQASIAALKVELEARGMDSSMLDLSGPAQERQAAKDAATLRAQPAAVEIPGAVHGNMGEVSVNGVYHPTQWALVDAAQHQATIGKAENQLRDRNRKSSEIQIENIANAPDVKQLLDSPLMDYGAPTMDRSGNIVGGNGRMEGLSRAYDRGNGAEYLGPLKERLAQFGIDPSAADGMQKPVLVRVVTSDIATKRLALASNEGSGLRMSALEQAKIDAERLPDIRGLKFAEDGSIPAAANQTHLRAWLAEFPATEAAALLDKTGNLSAEGAKRLQSAILYRAFGDSPLLERLVEAIDPEVRNAATALTRVAPKIAEAKAAIAAGERFPLDIAADLEAAVEQLANLRRSGEKIADFLNQNELFAENQLTPEARKILQFFGENARSPKAMAEMAANFYDQAKAAGNPSQSSMFAAAPPTKGAVLDAAIAATGKRLKSGDLFEQVQAANATVEPPKELIPADQLERLPPETQGKLKEMYQAAEAEKPQFDAINEQIAADVGGRYMSAPLKGAERAIDKIESDYNGDPTKIKDLLRSTIMVDTATGAQEAVAKIQAQYEVVGNTRNLFDPAVTPIDGYRDAKLNVVINGHIAEIQVNLPEMMEAKHEVHDQYAEREAITRRVERENRKFTTEELTMIDMLNSQMRAVYEPAWASAMSRLNSSAEMGVPLRRAETEGNLRGGDVSQAAQTGTDPGMFPNDTGMPSTSNSSTLGGMTNSDMKSSSTRTVEGGLESGKATPPEKQTLEQIFLDHPGMTVPIETRPGGEPQVVPAAGAVEIADANVAKAEADAPAFEAAITCFLRG